jgi:hypothetical protein
MMIYGETGRFPLIISLKCRMINFWARIVKAKNTKNSSIMFTINHVACCLGSTRGCARAAVAARPSPVDCALSDCALANSQLHLQEPSQNIHPRVLPFERHSNHLNDSVFLSIDILTLPGPRSRQMARRSRRGKTCWDIM